MTTSPDTLRPVQEPRPDDGTTIDHGAHERAHRGVFAAVRVVAGMTLLSRVGGLLRDVTTARVFGDTAVASAFAFAFLIPNVFRRLFGEGALAAAFIPEYASFEGKDPALSARFASLTLGLLVVIATAIALLANAGIVAALALADVAPNTRLTLELTAILLLYMPMICAVAILGGILQVHGKFGVVAASPVLLNAFIIVGALLAIGPFGLEPRRTTYVVAAAVLVSGVAQLAWSGWALRPYVRWTRAFAGTGESMRRMARRFVPVALGLGVLQLNTMFDMFIASWPVLVGPTIFGLAYPMDEASAGVISYTQRLYQFPLGVFGIAVATAVFPALARAASDKRLFTDMLRRGVRLSMFIAIPATIGLVLVRHDLAYVLFRGGNFSEAGVDRSAFILAGYAPAVWAYSLTHVFTRAFYARGDTVTPVRIAVCMVALNIVGNMTLIWVPWLGEAGLAWSTAISSTAQALLLARAARRFTDESHAVDGPTLGAVGRLLGAAAAMGAAVGVFLLLVDRADSWTHSMVRLFSACAIGCAAYVGVCAAMRRPELRWLLSRRHVDE